MRLGGFYGFTAPMLLMVYDDAVDNIIQNFNVSLNSVTALEMKKELWHFKKALEDIKYDIIVKNDKLPEYAQSARIEGGVLVGNSLDEEAQTDIIYSICDHCAAKLLERLYDSKQCLDVTSLENQDTFLFTLREVVMKSLESKSFSLDNIAPIVRSFLKNFNSDESKGNRKAVINNIKSFCSVEEKIPDIYYVNEQVIELDEDEYRVLCYFVKNKDKITEIQKAIKEDGVADENVFKISFMDFINRKPSSLYHMVVNQFDYLKNADIRLLPGVLRNVTEEFSKCKRLIHEKLLLEEKETETISVTQLDTYFSDNDAIDFLQSVFDNLHLTEIDVTDLKNLQTLYFASECLSIKYLNSVWETNFTIDSFNNMVSKLNKLHVGGINLFTSYLFKQSLQEIIFTSGGQIRKSQEYLTELQQVCNDIDALLSTFKPIGGDLSV